MKGFAQPHSQIRTESSKEARVFQTSGLTMFSTILVVQSSLPAVRKYFKNDKNK